MIGKIFKGRVKAVNSRGFGFIETKDSIDFFFHHTQLVDSEWKRLLQKYVSGETIFVEFENDIAAPSGPRALRVRVIEKGEENA